MRVKDRIVQKEILFKNIEDKTIAWFENSNQYLVLEKRAAQILMQLHQKIPIETIAMGLTQEYKVPQKDAIQFIIDLNENILIPNIEKQNTGSDGSYDEPIPSSFQFSKYYRINETVFKIDFFDEFELAQNTSKICSSGD